MGGQWQWVRGDKCEAQQYGLGGVSVRLGSGLVGVSVRLGNGLGGVSVRLSNGLGG